VQDDRLRTVTNDRLRTVQNSSQVAAEASAKENCS
jgi:hypothetical protein